MNVVWIVVDTLRAGRLGSYGYFRDTSPTIDRLACEGVLFEDFYSSALSTGAAFSCLLTGLPTIRHGFYPTPFNSPNFMNFDDWRQRWAKRSRKPGSHASFSSKRATRMWSLSLRSSTIG